MPTDAWVAILTSLLIICGLYFIPIFIESLHEKDKRVRKQSKAASVICLRIALLLPTLYFLFA